MKFYSALSLWLVLATATAIPVLAQNYMVDSTDPETVARALRDNGYRAKLSKDGEGDPMIESAAGGSTFEIFFFNCTEHAQCLSIQFFSGYADPPKNSAKLANDFNRTHRFAFAVSREDGSMQLEMDLDLDKGGISYPLFSENLSTFVQNKDEFEQHIGWSS